MKEFVDVVSFEIEAGHGGPGAVSFRREPYVPNGGPDGGPGGNGGNIIFLVDSRLTTFGSLRSKKKFIAENGVQGTARLSDGRKGEDVIIKVPCGTVIYDDDDGSVLVDLIEDEQIFIGAYGGKGGKGNKFYATPTNQAPDYAQHGLDGEKKNLRLEIKIIADIGFVGLPNAGKSSLLSAMTRANPKIASYPFTTLTPNLGVCYLDIDRSMVLADIPGIIEGAHKGVGLGFTFLRHIERTDILLYVLDITSESLFDDYQKLYNELLEYSQTLTEKKSFILLNKIDMIDEDECDMIYEDFLEKIEKQGIKNIINVFRISALASTFDTIRPIVEDFYRVLNIDKVAKKEDKKIKKAINEKSKYVFGPVNSKRLGHSLGIDVTPKKTCTYDCIYCQIGKNENTVISPIESVDADTVVFELKKHLHKYKDIDYITFSGSGEPTLYANIKHLIREIKNISDVPVCVITNGSLFYKQEIRSSIMLADLIIPSLDAGCEATFKKINMPNSAITFDKMVEGLISFSRVYKGRIWLEVFVIENVNDNMEEMKLISDIVSKMKVEKVQLLTADRPIAYKEYKPVSYEKLQELSKYFDCKVEVFGKPNYKKYGSNKEISDNDILALLQRHPTTKEGIAYSLQADISIIITLLAKLLEDKKIEIKNVDGDDCYQLI